MKAHKIAILVDPNEEGIRDESLECLGMALGMSSREESEITAYVLGKGNEAALERLRSFPVDGVVNVDHEGLSEYDPAIYSSTLKKVLAQRGDEVLLFPHTYRNMDLAPKLASRISSPLLTDCTGSRFEEEELIFTRQAFRNKLQVDLRIGSSFPWLITLQLGSFPRIEPLEAPRDLPVETVEAETPARIWKTLEHVVAAKERVDLTKAEVVIGVGRGVKSEEQLELISELAELLNAEIGASRPVVDHGWLERDRQIGSSGQTIAPKLYLSLGISGAIQHVVGVKNSNCIVAVNSDPRAPIFNIAHYGIVGDLTEIVPLLIEKLKEVKSS